MEQIQRNRLENTIRDKLIELRIQRTINLYLYEQEKDVNSKGLWRARLEQNQLSTWHYERILYGSNQTNREEWNLC